MQIAERLEGIGEYYFSQKLREIDVLNKQGKNILNLGIGNPDLPPHASVVAALNEQSQKQNVHGYQSYKGAAALREAIANWYKRWYGVDLNPETEVLPLAGSKEGILHVCMTYLSAGDEALIPNPGYPTYASAVALAGATPVAYTLRATEDWMPNFEELEKQDLSKVKLMWVNYPHMPTGQLPTQSLFEKLIAFGKKHNILICHDNPYSFILNNSPMSLLSVEGAKQTAIELNSLSKSHNMAGWRVGMLCGAAQRVNDVLRFKSNMDSGMFLPVQMAAAQALSLGEEWHAQVNGVYLERRELAFELLDVLQCTYAKTSAGMFVWAAVPSQYKNSFELSDKVLNEAGVFITPGGIFGSEGTGFVRVSLCSSNNMLIEANERIKKVFL